MKFDKFDDIQAFLNGSDTVKESRSKTVTVEKCGAKHGSNKDDDEDDMGSVDEARDAIIGECFNKAFPGIPPKVFGEAAAEAAGYIAEAKGFDTNEMNTSMADYFDVVARTIRKNQ